MNWPIPVIEVVHKVPSYFQLQDCDGKDILVACIRTQDPESIIAEFSTSCMGFWQQKRLWNKQKSHYT